MTLMQLLFSFQGRIKRSQWWLAQLGSGVVVGVIISIVMMAFGPSMRAAGASGAAMSPVAGLIILLVWIAALWVGLALNVKRCHDRDKSGWFVLIGLIPIIGGLWLLIELGFLDGTQGPNKYGPSPKSMVGVPAHA